MNMACSSHVCCRNSGKLGHTLSVCPDLKQTPAQIHAMARVDDASDASDEESVIILAQFNEAVLVQDDSAAESRPLNSDLVLLDSQSTVDLFSNPNHVTNICPVNTPICVHCNKGILATNEEAYFGNTLVYFDSCGIVNVLSLYCLGQKFQVTYDSLDRGSVF
jgi:hypothetical protein